MSARIPESKWVWCGLPGHFIAADSCRFHLHTRVGRFRISTVGDYRPMHVFENGAMRLRNDKDGPDTIGHDRLYETMVFEVDGDGEHGLGSVRDWGGLGEDWAWGSYNDSVEACEGHMAVCRAAALAKNQREKVAS